MADRQSLEETTNCEDATECPDVDVRNVKFTHGDSFLVYFLLQKIKFNKINVTF